MDSPRTFISIQFLRFLAALMVVCHHTQIALMHHGLGSDAIAAVSRWTDMGAAGVHLFFVISGFIMVLTTEGGARGQAAGFEFLVRRLIRIYPFYILCCGVYLVAFAAMGQSHQATLAEFALSLLLVPGHATRIIGPGWTLAYEVYFYLCFAAGLLLSGRKGLVVLTVVFLVCGAIGAIARFRHPILDVMTNLLLVEFLLGAWIAIAVLGRRSIDKCITVAALAGSISIVLIALLWDLWVPTVLLWGVPSALLIFALAAQEKRGSAPGWMKRYRSFGDASYALYLVHILVLDLTLIIIKSWGGGSDLGPVWAIVGVATSVGVAMLAHGAIEKPLQDILRSRYRAARVLPN